MINIWKNFKDNNHLLKNKIINKINKIKLNHYLQHKY